MSTAHTADSARTPAGPAEHDAVSGSALPAGSILDAADTFPRRHIGPDEADIQRMLAVVGAASLDAFIDSVVPESIRLRRPLDLPPAKGEHDALDELRALADSNVVSRACIGMGYHGTITPAVIRRNVLENPGWYTQYTPYQAELAQGRLEALLNFQTMLADLTSLPIANASLLDEATAAAEAMAMCHNIAPGARPRFFVAGDCHPQTLGVLRTRADGINIELVVGDPNAFTPDDTYCGVLVQYPTTDGRVECYEDLASRAHAVGVLVVAAADPLALALLRPPGEWGADICIGSAQRFGVPMGGGGPHAGYITTREEHVRKLPGRLVGVSKDTRGKPAYRLAIQTREQHIKRDRATSNICTAQVLLAVIAGFYGVYHGPDGLRRIAQRVRAYTTALRAGLIDLGCDTLDDALVFDTLRVTPKGRTAVEVIAAAHRAGIELRDFGDGTIGIALDETANRQLIADILECFGGSGPSGKGADVDALLARADTAIPEPFARSSGYMTHPVFNTHRSETEMLRYIRTLESRDQSLCHSMIPLGSCTMKLNASSEMLPISWPGFAGIHPFAPVDRAPGYHAMFDGLERWLAEITGFAAVSLQPNAGSQGEYAGLLVIDAYHRSRGDEGRKVCLIPDSAHGTNPASAVCAGMRVVGVKTTADGAIDMADLRAKAEHHASELAAVMVTYPSTCGVFEPTIRDICAIVHEHGGQVYLDGANLNAQVGLCRPGDYGADVCHLNLHKTFCIPHGGGGPGMGPIGCAEHLRPFLPGHPVDRPRSAGAEAIGPVSAAPYGSPSILPISWMYIAMMGPVGLRRASEIAILSANYMAQRLKDHYPLLFTGPNGRVAHEFVIDCRPFKKSAGIEIDDIAKRLIDYGFHAPTMSWPVPGTLMIEPTESESLEEVDRLCDALIAIRAEIAEIEAGTLSKDNNPLKHAPHTIADLTDEQWDRPYTRERGVYPAPGLRQGKFWPAVNRVDNPYGDRNLACTCPPMSAFSES